MGYSREWEKSPKPCRREHALKVVNSKRKERYSPKYRQRISPPGSAGKRRTCATKRIKVINKKTLRNKMIKSQVKTAMKKVIVAVNAGDKETAAVALKNAVSAIDRAYIKGIYHKNAVARKKSSLTRLVNSL